MLAGALLAYMYNSTVPSLRQTKLNSSQPNFVARHKDQSVWEEFDTTLASHRVSKI